MFSKLFSNLKFNSNIKIGLFGLNNLINSNNFIFNSNSVIKKCEKIQNEVNILFL